MTTYLFYRLNQAGDQFFYPVELAGDGEVLPNVESNPGTVKVTTLNGRIVWRLQ